MAAINTNYKNDISTIEAIEGQLKNISDAGFSQKVTGFHLFDALIQDEQ